MSNMRTLRAESSLREMHLWLQESPAGTGAELSEFSKNQGVAVGWLLLTLIETFHEGNFPAASSPGGLEFYPGLKNYVSGWSLANRSLPCGAISDCPGLLLQQLLLIYGC